jgi:predicted DNA-binding transcriptional regulator AlpA
MKEDPTIYLRDTDLARRFNVHRATIWNWVREYGFPRPVKLTDSCTRWRASDVAAWEVQRSTQSGELTAT